MRPDQVLLVIAYLFAIFMVAGALLRRPLRTRSGPQPSLPRDAFVDEQATWSRLAPDRDPDELIRLKARMLQVTACVIAALGILFSIWIMVRYEVPGHAPLVLTMGLAASVWRASRRRLAPSADEVRQRDTRPPVLLLRPFEWDRRTGSLASGWRPSVEETLAEAFGGYGPFVALHDPMQRHPHLGAARLRADDTQWQETVTRCLTEARFVVLLVAPVTDSLKWEIQEAARVLRPEQLVLVLPTRSNGKLIKSVYDDFRRATYHLFPRGIPYVPDAGAFLITFDPQWIPICITPKNPEYKDPLPDCAVSYMSLLTARNRQIQALSAAASLAQP
jgi:hypothetical protein